MTFEEALALLRKGTPVRRATWREIYISPVHVDGRLARLELCSPTSRNYWQMIDEEICATDWSVYPPAEPNK